MYGISTTQYMWYPITDHSGRNISSRQLIFLVDQIPSIWVLPLKWVSGNFCPIIYLTKSHITNWAWTMYNLPLFIYLIAFIIKIIILSFFYHFLIYRTNSSLEKILGQLVPPIAMRYLLCWVYTVPRPIYYVECFTPVLYAQTILHICTFFPFRFIQHHLPILVLYIPESDIQTAIVSNAKIPAPPSCALSSFPWTLCVYTARILVS